MLLEAGRRGHGTVVVDMTRTRYCDSAGFSALVAAHKWALADGGGLRLVIPDGSRVLRIFTVIGLGRFIPGSAAWIRPCPRDLPPSAERVTPDARFPGERQWASRLRRACLYVWGTSLLPVLAGQIGGPADPFRRWHRDRAGLSIAELRPPGRLWARGPPRAVLVPVVSVLFPAPGRGPVRPGTGPGKAVRGVR